MTPTKLNKVEQFFYENASYSYDPLKETAEEGRTKGAVLLASAEQWARETGYGCRWEIDPASSSADWIDDNEDGGNNQNPWQVWSCYMYDENGKPVQSLHSIDFGRDGQPWGDPYRRVIEAELALEEWHAVVKQ